MILLDPTSEGLKDSYNLAPRRFRSLDGVRLGLLGNSKLNADKILDAVGEILSERYAVETVFHRMKPSFSRPVPDELKKEMLSHCDVVIAGVGDWGSCSAASVADGTIFEHEGLQAASIVTSPFLKTADSMARRNGYPEYRYAVMPHPIGNLRPDQIRQRAEALVDDVLSILGVTEPGNGK